MKKIFRFLLAFSLLFMSIPMQVHAQEEVEPCKTFVVDYVAENFEQYGNFLMDIDHFIFNSCISEEPNLGYKTFKVDLRNMFSLSSLDGTKISKVEAVVAYGGENFENYHSSLDVEDGTGGVENGTTVTFENYNSGSFSLFSIKPVYYKEFKVYYSAHEWAGATCYKPKTCTNCGYTDGQPLNHVWIIKNCNSPRYCLNCYTLESDTPYGHSWQEATCTKAKTCEFCLKTEGEALGHQWQEATCYEPKTCTLCKITEGNALEHELGYKAINIYEHQWTCLKCNDLYEETQTRPHKYVRQRCIDCGIYELPLLSVREKTESIESTNTQFIEGYEKVSKDFTVSGYMADKNGVRVREGEPDVVISANDQMTKIERIEFKVGLGSYYCPNIKVSSGTKSELVDDVFEVTGINAPSLTLSFEGLGLVQIKEITVHYYKFNEKELGHKCDLYFDNGDGTYTLFCEVCGKALTFLHDYVEQAPSTEGENTNTGNTNTGNTNTGNTETGNTNTENTTPNETPASSNTGDNNQMYLYAMLLLASGTTTLILRRKKEME